jgi:ammonia channel protein AmtB
LSNKKGTSDVSVGGFLYTHDFHQFLYQLAAAAFIIVWSAIGTFVVLKITSLFVRLRASDGEVEGGDLAIHGVDPMPLPVPAPTG